MVEGQHKQFRYRYRVNAIDVMTTLDARDSVLQSYYVGGGLSAEAVHRFARGHIELDFEELAVLERATFGLAGAR